jgi:hypothetical protein
MHPKLTETFYGLSIFVLGTVLFVMQPNQNAGVATVQSEIKQSFSIAWQQTIGDQPYFTDLAEVYDGVEAFFKQTTDATIALFQGSESDTDIAFIYKTVYQDFAGMFNQTPHTAVVELPAMPKNFMAEKPINNIVPEVHITKNTYQGSGEVAGVSVDKPVNDINSWVTIRDNYTGQLYCLAVYNGDVNKYLGACKNDYH